MSDGVRSALKQQRADPAPAPAPAPRVAVRSEQRVQPSSLRLSQPGDAGEREADRVAGQVMAMPGGAEHGGIAARERVPVLAARAPAGPLSGAAGDSVASDVASEIRSLAGGGAPLRSDTRRFMEPRFRADFSGVRVHTGSKAAGLAARLGASAFTHGRDVAFGKGAYRPESEDGKRLIAHELTHTIQQGGAAGAVHRSIDPGAPVTVRERSGPQVQRGIVSRALDWIADKANYIPGFRLLTIVIGRNPINMASVSRSGENILRAMIEFIPGGPKIAEALQNHGVLQKGGKFIEAQFAALADLGGSIRDALMQFVDSLGITDLASPGDVWDRAKRIFTAPVDRAIAFGRNLVSGIAEIVKEAIVKPLGAWAKANVPKWDLLVGVFGKNPISEEGESPASALIGAFMNLIGQGEIWENIKKGNAIARAWQWFQTAMKGAKALVTGIPGRVVATIRSLTIFDIVTIVGAFAKIAGAFGSFVGDFMRWAGGTVLNLLEIILSVVAPSVVPYLKKAGGAFSTIIRNPIGFVRTLVAAGKAGFSQFAGNFLNHLKASLIGWLTGAMGGAGIYIPQGLNFREILKFALSVMGLTWANIRAKLVAATNETTVKALETGFDIVKTLVTEGPAAAWQQIMETLSNLKQMAIDAVMDFVKSRVVQAAVTKLLSMLSPAGAFIQAIIAIYNTVMFFVERLRQIAAVAASFIDSIAAIAAGNISAAAGRVERTLAGLLTLVISFLARIAGLGKVSDAVIGLINKIRAPIDKALDKVVAWIVSKAKALGTMILQAGVPSDPQARLRLAAKHARTLAKALRGPVSKPVLDAAFAALKTRYSLSGIEAFERGAKWFVRVKINPSLEDDLDIAGVKFTTSEIIKAIDEVAGELLAAGKESIKGKPGTATKIPAPGPEGSDQKEQVDVTRFDLREHQAIGAGVAAVRTKGRHELVMGNIEGNAQPLTAGHTPEQQFRPSRFKAVRGVGSGGASGPKGNNYDILSKRLEGQPVGDWLLRMAQNKPLPDKAAEYRNELEELYALLIAKEPSHDKFGQKRDLVYSLMSIDTMTGETAKSAKEVVGREGSHPSAFVNAQAGAKVVSDQISGKTRKKKEGERELSEKEILEAKDKRLGREQSTILAWFRKNEAKLVEKIPKPTLLDVKNFIRAQLAALVGSRTK